MRSCTLFLVAFAAMAPLASPASAAGRVPGGGGLMPPATSQWDAQRRITAEPVKSPYPVTYSEQVAQSLGLRDGGVSLYEGRESARNPFAPSVVVGGTMLRLRWKQ